MLAPLYPIATSAATITVVSPGAIVGATSVRVEALTIEIPAGVILDFGARKFAKLAAGATVDSESLDTAPIPTALVAGDVATIPGSPAAAILSEKFSKQTADKRLAMELTAEMLLDLRAPAYTGDDADELGFAKVLQLNFMVEQGITPKVTKSVTTGKIAGTAEGYRDRWLNPDAVAIVERVTGRRAVRFTPTTAGL